MMSSTTDSDDEQDSMGGSGPASSPRNGNSRRGFGRAESSGRPASSGSAAAPVAPLAALLEDCPETKRALETYYKGGRPEAQLQSLTPLTILNQHANRMKVEVSFTEQAETPTGPFTVSAKICLPGAAAAPGRARSSLAAYGNLTGVGKVIYPFCLS